MLSTRPLKMVNPANAAVDKLWLERSAPASSRRFATAGECLSELVNSLKGVSSRRLKVEFPAISTFWSVRKSQRALWSPSYFVGSVGGAAVEILRHYIESQGRSEPPA
jgi:Transposase IS200 like